MNNLSKNWSGDTYEIRVHGSLEASWSDRLGGMKITHTVNDHGSKATILCGQLPDQAALFGVLNALYDMHLPLISVRCVDAD